MDGKTLLRQARAAGAPVIEGPTATFVWRGRTAPGLIGDFNDWEASAALRLEPAGPGVWARCLTFPRDAYVEYAYVRPAAGRKGQTGEARRVADPLNPRTTPNGLGHVNHYFYMPEAAPTPLAQRNRRRPRGTVTRHVLSAGWLAGSGRREVYLYRPPVDEPCPLLLVYDGDDYLRRAQLATLVDNLIAEGRIQPLAMALLAKSRTARYLEYACSDATLAVVQNCVLPLAQAELNLLQPQSVPGGYGVLGASMGGLMALYTGLRLPHLFGRVLSQSGAFTTFTHDHVVYDLVRYGPTHALRVWMDVGQYDLPELAPTNPRMRDVLREKGYTVEYREYNAGHNYPAWRDDVWRGLEWLFPGTGGS